MKLLFATLLMVMVRHQVARGNEQFACNLAALTKTERATHRELTQRLLGAVEERRELQSGYAFRLPAKTLLTAAQWVSLERRCCPFFAFELVLTKDGGPLWLRISGAKGINPDYSRNVGNTKTSVW